MCCLSSRPVSELKKHRVCDVETGKLVESGGWEDEFSTVVQVWTLGAGEHHSWVASVVFVKTAWTAAAGAWERVWIIHGVRVEGVKLLLTLVWCCVKHESWWRARKLEIGAVVVAWSYVRELTIMNFQASCSW